MFATRRAPPPPPPAAAPPLPAPFARPPPPPPPPQPAPPPTVIMSHRGERQDNQTGSELKTLEHQVNGCACQVNVHALSSAKHALSDICLLSSSCNCACDRAARSSQPLPLSAHPSHLGRLHGLCEGRGYFAMTIIPGHHNHYTHFSLGGKCAYSICSGLVCVSGG